MPDSGPNPRSSNLTIEVEKVSDDSNSRVQKIELDESETSSMYEAKQKAGGVTNLNPTNISLISPSAASTSMAGLSMASLSEGGDCSSDENRNNSSRSDGSDTDVVKVESKKKVSKFQFPSSQKAGTVLTKLQEDLEELAEEEDSAIV